MEATISPPTDEQRIAVLQRPDERAVMRQTWSNLLFLHWRVRPESIQQTLPEGLFVDTFDDSAWLGVVPFEMRNIRPAGLFSVPWLSFFLELNVRTYVHDEQGNPGVWFYSLDTNRWLAYKIARTFFKLPYFPANMKMSRRDDGLLGYRAHRTGEVGPGSEFVYSPADRDDELATAEVGTLEFFLLERYLLFSHDERRRRLFSGQVNHEPYQFQNADVREWDAAPVEWDGLSGLVNGNPIHQCVAQPVDVEVFRLKGL
ncbi:MAG: DUF2071 domain-containing protein [Verrucomicrobiales bacterium]|nr:DUF2071 domain-containing protein [Verrucomicrobiales bacterium]